MLFCASPARRSLLRHVICDVRAPQQANDIPTTWTPDEATSCQIDEVHKVVNILFFHYICKIYLCSKQQERGKQRLTFQACFLLQTHGSTVHWGMFRRLFIVFILNQRMIYSPILRRYKQRSKIENGSFNLFRTCGTGEF